MRQITLGLLAALATTACVGTEYIDTSDKDETDTPVTDSDSPGDTDDTTDTEDTEDSDGWDTSNPPPTDTSAVDTSENGNDTDNGNDTYTPPPDETDVSDSGGGFVDTSVCPFGEVLDCTQTCYPAYFIGDGTCDDGTTFGADFDCDRWSYDGGDCNTDTAPDTANPCIATLVYTTGSWASEVGWELQDSAGNTIADSPTGSYPSNNTTYTHSLYLSPGETYTVIMIDSYGDGWNGGSFTVTTLGGLPLGSGSLPSGSYGETTFIGECDGGTGFFAINEETADTAADDGGSSGGGGGGTSGDIIDPNATGKDGDCDDVVVQISTNIWANEVTWNLLDPSGNVIATGTGYVNGTVYDVALPPVVPGNYTFEMIDSYGDGWNGTTWLVGSALDGNLYGSGTLPSGSYGTSTVDIDCDPLGGGPTLPPLDTAGCAAGATEDCDGVCWPISYLGDGFCDDGTTYATNFDCPQFNGDQGDCP